MRLTIDSETNRYTTTVGESRPIPLHSYYAQNKTYTGTFWTDEVLTLKSTDQIDSGDDGAEQNAASDSQMLYNVGIIAAIIVILLSGSAILSMMREPEE